MNIVLFILSCVFTHNAVFNRALGVSDAGKNRPIDVAMIYGLACCVVMTLVSVCAFLVDTYILVPMNFAFLRIICFVLLAILAAWLTQLCLSKVKPDWASRLEGAFMPIAVNCAVVGVAFLNIQEPSGYTFLNSLLQGLFGGVGLWLAIVLMAGIQEKIEFSKVPEPFRGLPITMISAGMIALAFAGFKGIA